MRRRIVFSLAMISILLVLSTALCYNPVRGADYTKVGVSLGATADYSLSSGFGTVDKMRIFVYGIAGSIVTLNITEYYPNGTAGAGFLYAIDLVIGGGASIYLISGGLSPGDPISSGSSYVISDSPTRLVAGASRPQNHVVHDNYTGTGARIDWYWDQATGLATEIRSWDLAWYNFTLVSTSMWGGPPLTTILLVSGAIVVVIAAVVLIRRRR